MNFLNNMAYNRVIIGLYFVKI